MVLLRQKRPCSRNKQLCKLWDLSYYVDGTQRGLKQASLSVVHRKKQNITV